jgi:3-hydroxyisobutyrate dehydrogenase
MNKPRIGYLGLGLMGLPMVLRLLENGYEVAVWNRSVEKCKPAINAGATPAQNPRDLGEKCDLLLTCLTDANAMEAVVFGPHGVSSGKAPSILMDFSSIHPEATKGFADRAKRLTGMSWLDAPVSGGTPAAKAGTLTFMVGGSPDDFDVVRPVLAVLGKNVTLMGPTGSGQMTKLVNQVISGCTMTILAEAVNLAEKSGVDSKRLVECLSGGFADSQPFQLITPRMANRTFEDPLGTVSMMLKDVETIRQVGESCKAALPMTEAACKLMMETVDFGHGEDDISTLILTYSQKG